MSNMFYGNSQTFPLPRDAAGHRYQFDVSVTLTSVQVEELLDLIDANFVSWRPIGRDVIATAGRRMRMAAEAADPRLPGAA